MKIPEWLRPALFGAASGAIALAIVGFSWGGWMTGRTADKMASDHARLAVVAALVPICLQQVKQDPQSPDTLAKMEQARSSYERTNMLMQTGWATVPGASESDRGLASACMDKLEAQF
ncbi:MAG: hypothetical protein OEN55_06030 [Alphaproteobacteria bacterium]|nr:hypothetical protein [Alphaproteobacteria bacterium]